MAQEQGLSRNEIRRRGLISLCSQFDVSLEVLLENYSEKHFFNSTINKKEFFNEIINNKLSKESVDFLEQRCSYSYHKDNRASIDYGIDLAIGWLAEDLVLQKLSNFGFTVKSFGNDAHREYLPQDEIGTQADYILKTNNKDLAIELVISWNNYWQKTNRLDLRDSKFRRLSSREIDSVLIGIEPMSHSFFISSVAVMKKYFQWRENPAWGNKGVYTLHAIDKVMRPISMFKREYLLNFLK